MPVPTPAPPPSTLNCNKLDQAGIRAHRKRIAELVHNDFHFEAPPPSFPTTPEYTEQSHTTRGHDVVSSLIDPTRVKSWQEYRFASSDPSSENEEDEDEATGVAKAFAQYEDEQRQRAGSQSTASEGFSNKMRRKRKSLLSHILPSDNSTSGSVPASPISPASTKFVTRQGSTQDETEDADDESERLQTFEQVTAARKKAERKNRRRRRLEEERSWNCGLDFWARRRDAWCCARTVETGFTTFNCDRGQEQATAGQREERTRSEPTTASVVELQKSAEPIRLSLPNEFENLQINTDVPQAEMSPRPDTPSSQPSSQACTGSRASSATALTSPTYSDTHLPRRSFASQFTTQIPLLAPLLPPSDPSRSQMHNPKAHTAIYSKVIIQGLTPNVPINLKTMTSALVQGWKQDGEWPPPGTQPKPSISIDPPALREDHSVLGKGMRKGREKLKERRASKRIT